LTRKSVSYLTALRINLTDEIHEALETSIDLQNTMEDLQGFAPEDVRLDRKASFNIRLQTAEQLHRSLGKQLKQLKNTTNELQRMF
jgi:hypothetical protein